MTQGDTPPSGSTSHRNEATPELAPAPSLPATRSCLIPRHSPVPAKPANGDADGDGNRAVVARASAVVNNGAQGTNADAGTTDMAAAAAAAAHPDKHTILHNHSKE